MERGPKPKFHKVKTLSPAELEQREMEEYEYEVTFAGPQWFATVLVYHEDDNEDGLNKDAQTNIIHWAEAVASEKGLSMDYEIVSVNKTATLGAYSG